MDHQSIYSNNEDYAHFLAGWGVGFYAKYIDHLVPSVAGGRVLDVGCGVGQVVGSLVSKGINAFGVDVSRPNVERAIKVCPQCQVYDGHHIPFDSGYFDTVGSFNVLEHVDKPEEFIKELIRVVMPGGHVVVSTPNFLRVFGFRDYHPHMRGLANKWRNWKRLREKRAQMQHSPEAVHYDVMPPIVRQPFCPDDDAINATNSIENAYFLEREGCEVLRIDCTDRYTSPFLEKYLNRLPLKLYILNSFIIAKKLS